MFLITISLLSAVFTAQEVLYCKRVYSKLDKAKCGIPLGLRLSTGGIAISASFLFIASIGTIFSAPEGEVFELMATINLIFSMTIRCTTAQVARYIDELFGRHPKELQTIINKENSK